MSKCIEVAPLSEPHIELLAELDETRLGAKNRKTYLEKKLELCQKEPKIFLHFVAVSEAQPVGHLGIVFAGEQISIETLVVSQDGKSIATHLVLAASQHGCEAGAESIGLEVRASNKRALKLYSRFGLAPVGVRKEYYPANPPTNPEREDAILMWCHQVQTKEFQIRLNKISESLKNV